MSRCEQSQRGRTSRQTDATKAARRAVRTTGLRLQQRWAQEVPQYTRTDADISSSESVAATGTGGGKGDTGTGAGGGD